MAAEKWHPEQEGRYLDDGRYELKVPYADDREIIMDILKYGADCEVISPPNLIERVKDQYRQMLDLYRKSNP